MSLMEKCVEVNDQYWNKRAWERYVDGEMFHCLHDIRVANTFKTCLIENAKCVKIEEYERYLENIAQTLYLIDERKCDEIEDSEELRHMDEMKAILTECQAIVLTEWTAMAMKLTSSREHKNELIRPYKHISVSLWQVCSERKNKILFFPGIQVEVPPFLQSIRILSYSHVYSDDLMAFFRQCHAGYLYTFDRFDEDNESSSDDTDERFINSREHSSQKNGFTLQVEKIIKTIRFRHKQTTNGKAHQQTPQSCEQQDIVCSGDDGYFRLPTSKLSNLSVTKKKKKSRSPDDKKKKKKKKDKKRKKKGPQINEQKMKEALMTNVVNIFDSPHKISAAEDADLPGASTHVVDMRSESIIGSIHTLKSFRTASKKKQSGAWLVHTETAMDEFELTGEVLHVSLKVPVEEVFIGPSEPTVAYKEENGGTWKKGVFTTHNQFDQNTFVVSTHLSKLGKIALFQQNDFHYPYRNWSLEFLEDRVHVYLHTSTVALRLLFQDAYVMLHAQTGDEFSKLRALHDKQYSLQDMCRQLLKHGVYVFPNEKILKKYKDQVKDDELELYASRYLVLYQLDAHTSRINSSLGKDTISINLLNKSMQITKAIGGGYEVSFTEDTGGAEQGPRITQPFVLSNVFRWILITRMISITK